MSDKPAWRWTYDAVETTVTPWVEAVVHTGKFASTTTLLARTRRQVGDQVNGVAARFLHLFNLPARTDIQRLRRQVGALDREVRRLSAELDQQARQQD
jgi:hypothetical protein